MFPKLFKRKKSYKDIDVPSKTIQFLGEPSGADLKADLTNILAAEGNASKAYLRYIKYSDEDCIRIALVIDGKKKMDFMGEAIARECLPLVHIDLLFFETLTPQLIQEIQNGAPPFYIASFAPQSNDC